MDARNPHLDVHLSVSLPATFVMELALCPA